MESKSSAEAPIEKVQAPQESTPFQVLKTQVYPVINEIILKVLQSSIQLIDHIVKSEEVSKHEERLKKKKVIDELEKKYIERDIEKEEMGSDYEESDDEEFHKALGMKKDAVETLVRRRIEKHKNKILDEDDTELDQNVFNPIDYIISELKAYQAQRGK